MKRLLLVLITLLLLSVVFALASSTAYVIKQDLHGQADKIDKIMLKSRRFTPDKHMDNQMVGFGMGDARKHVIIQLDHIPSQEEKKELEGNGIKLLDYIPNNAWFASVQSLDINQIAARPDVTYIGPILPEDKIGYYSDGNEETEVTVLFFPDVSRDEIEGVIQKYGNVIEEPSIGNAWIISMPANRIRVLAGEDAVQWIEKRLPLTVFNDGSRAAIGVDTVQASPYNLNGTGVVVAEWDEGYANHGDYNSRTTIGDPGEGSSVQHSTHVAGTMVGDGNLSELEGGSALQWKGMAPNATLITYEWPNDPSELFDETNNSIAVYGAILSQNSWGYHVHGDCSVLGDYDIWSAYYDNITNGFGVDSPVTVVFAAGNERSTGLHSPPSDYYCGYYGYTYNTTAGPGSTAKNVITVGAVDKSENMASFSSWGPTDDGRIKPDVVAVGVSVKSTWMTDTYNTQQGTSMAAPAVSGVIALIHEDYRDKHGGLDPLPSTVKALLIHTAEDLNETGPDYTTGWGLVNATAAIDKIREDVNGTEVITEDNVSNGENDTYYIYVPSGQSALNITLVWDDYPGTLNGGPKLINNLDLVVTNSSGYRFYPWTLDPGNPANAAVRTTGDSVNNVEQVYVENPNEGIWTIMVNGTSVPQGPETYSLVSSNDFGLTVILESPEDGYGSNSPNVTFNCSATDGSGLSNMTLYTSAYGGWQANETKTLTGISNSSEWNLTGISDGTYVWNCRACDLASNCEFNDMNRTFTVDAIPPTWSNNQTNLTGIYSSSVLSYFNITWNDNIGISIVYIEGNWSGENNYSMHNLTSPDVYEYNVSLPAGTFYWKSYANDSGGNLNVSDTWVFTVQKATTSINLTLNGTDGNETYEAGEIANLTAVLNVSNKTVFIYKNGIDLDNGTSPFEYSWNTSGEALGLHNITADFPGDDNYTGSSETHWLAINDTVGPDISSPNTFHVLILLGENIAISATITDNFQVNSSEVTFNISNSTWYDSGSMDNASDLYNASYNTTNMSLGEYNVTVYANDTSGNQANASADVFKIAEPRNISIDILDYQNNATNASKVRVLYNGTSSVRNESGENVTEFASILPEGFWDIEVITGTFNITLTNVNVTNNMSGNVSVDDNISESGITLPDNILSFVETVSLETSFNFTIAHLTVAYNNSSIINETRIQVYACHEWVLASRTCFGSWENITDNSTIDTDNDLVIINTTNLSAFSVGEGYSCGDGIVDSGESCDGSNLSGETCSSQGFTGGNLACSASCEFDTSGCSTATDGDGGISSFTSSLPPKRKEIRIIGYPDEIGIIRNESGEFIITLNNTGEVNLTQVNVSITTNCNSCEIFVAPNNISLPVGEVQEFNVLISIPVNQSPGIYTLNLNITSAENASNETAIYLKILACSPNKFKCFANDLKQCNIFGTTFIISQTCKFGCSEGKCNPPPRICMPNEKQCINNSVSICNTEGTYWLLSENCNYGCSDSECNPKPIDYSWLIVFLAIMMVIISYRKLRKKGYWKFERSKIRALIKNRHTKSG